MYKFRQGEWEGVIEVDSKSFVCWNCNKSVASEKAYRSYHPNIYRSYVYICPHCKAPVVFDDERKPILLPFPGDNIEKIPEDVGVVYSEIRKCMQSGCFNGAVMLMRKLIMHIAVEEGGSAGETFVSYIDFLCTDGIVPKKSKSKADSVRTLGNSANHEIESITQDDAQNAFEFIELLLRVNYEFADEDESIAEEPEGEAVEDVSHE